VTTQNSPKNDLTVITIYGIVIIFDIGTEDAFYISFEIAWLV